MKKGIIIAAAVLTAVGLAIFIGVLCAVGFDASKISSVRYETNTYPVGEVFTDLEIRTTETDVVLKPSADGSCTVVCEERENAKHTVCVENGTLKVLLQDERSFLDHIALFSKSMTLTVYLPLDRYQSLTVDSNTGDVTVPDSFAFETAVITAKTSDIAFRASASGLLKIETTTGDIRTEGVRAGEILLSATTGQIDVGSAVCEGEVSASVKTGKVNLSDVTCQSFRSKGSTGDLTMKNVIASNSFTVERGTGDIRFDRCDAQEITVTASTGDVTGTLLSEKVFVAKTSTGRVVVPETTSGGTCRIQTSTGDIRITLAAE